MRLLRFLLLFVLASAANSFATTLTFKNGDRLTGHWLRVEGKKLIFKSEALGQVKIPLAKLEGFQSEKPVVLMLTNGKRVQGTMALAPSGKWIVETPEKVHEVPVKDVAAAYPYDFLEKQVPEHRPRVLQSWSGKGSMGYSLAHGDRNSGTLSVNFNAIRREPNLPGLSDRLRTNFFLNMLFANTENTKGQQVSVNNITTGLRQDFLYSPHKFWFLLAQADHSQTQSLDLRQTYGAGLGRDLLRRSGLALQFLGGLTLVNENFVNAKRQKHSEGLLGEKIHWRMTSWLSLDNTLNFYPALEWGGRYRVEGTAALSTQINSRLSFNTMFSNQYLSLPLPGHQKNDLVLTTGLGLRF